MRRELTRGQEKLQERIFVFLAVETPFWCSCNFCLKKWLVEGEEGVSGAWALRRLRAGRGRTGVQDLRP